MSLRTQVKKLAKRILRPVWGPIRERIDMRLQPIEARLASVEAKLSRNLATSAETVASMERVQSQFAGELGRLWERMEFVRREIMFEMKYGQHTSPASVSRLEPKVISQEKFARARQVPPRLNLGCGHIPLEGYLNVDQRELPGVDLIAEAGNVALPAGAVDEIFSAHLLEHFPQEELRRRLLPYWFELLRPEGIFRAVVPDGEAMLAGLAAGSYAFEDFREVLFGAQDYAGDFHFSLFTPQSLTKLLQEAGFIKVQVPAKARRNGKCFEFEIVALRPPLPAAI